MARLSGFHIVCVLFLLLAPALGGGGLTTGLAHELDEFFDHAGKGVINNLLPKLAHGFTDGFKFSLQQLDKVIPEVTKQLLPFLQQVGSGFLKGEETMSADIAKQVTGVITHTNLELSAMGLVAAGVTQLMIDHTIEEIKDKIIDEIAIRLQALQEYFFDQLNQILHKIWLAAAAIDCSVKGDIARIYNDRYKLLSHDCVQPDPSGCCQKINVVGNNLTSLGDSELYGLGICRHLARLTPDLPLHDVLAVYSDVTDAASTFYCIDNSVSTSADFFTQEYNTYSGRYWYWKAVTQDYKMSNCNTGAECYRQAVQNLNKTSDTELGKKATLSMAYPLYSQLRNELKVTFPVVNKSNPSQDPRSPCPAGWQQWGMLGISTNQGTARHLLGPRSQSQFYRACMINSTMPAPPSVLPLRTAATSSMLPLKGNAACDQDPMSCYQQAIEQVRVAEGLILSRADRSDVERLLSEHTDELKLVNLTGCPEGWVKKQDLMMETRHPGGTHLVGVCSPGTAFDQLELLAQTTPVALPTLPLGRASSPGDDATAVLADATRIQNATMLAVEDLVDKSVLQALSQMEENTVRFFSSTACPTGWKMWRPVQLTGKKNHIDLIACHKVAAPTPAPTPSPTIPAN